MGIDWQPFRLKSNVSRAEFDKMIIQQRRTFYEWHWLRHLEMTYPDINEQVEFGLADSAPEYSDSFRLTLITRNPVFPDSWNDRLYTTCFPDRAQKLIDRRKKWINRIREKGMNASMKLKYIEDSNDDYCRSWSLIEEKAHEILIDNFFEWTQNWIDRGYGMFLSF